LEVFYLKKVKMKTSMAGMEFSYLPGQEVEVRNDVAEAWKEAGLAEIIEEEKPKEKAKKKKSDE
jgi:hypothetical protein